jgi:uncharacterized membrane protein
MNGLYIIGGAILGLFAGTIERSPMLGLAAGLLIGWLFARTTRLQRELEELTRKLRAPGRRAAVAHQPEPEAEEEERSPPVTTAPPETRVGLEEPGVIMPVDSGRDFEPVREAAETGAVTAPTEPALVERLFEAAKNWITTGNVPVKVGILLSFIGVSFLLKYAIDRNLFNVPIEVRLLGVAVAGLVMAFIGWRLRGKRRGYALSLQGGGAGILFLTVYAAMRIWQLLPEVTAFALLFLIAAAIAILAVLQNARTLALFGVIGGFLAPVLASTGEGSHVVLFSYYLVINLAILAIAWFRAWRVLNLVGFVFTFIISFFWGYRYFTPELFSSTEPFLVLFFLFYQGIAILYALRRSAEKPDAIDGTLVFGTPVITFALQSAMLSGSEYGLAWSALALAVFYGGVAVLLRGRPGRHPQLLTEAYLALAVAFATLAIPLAFDARWTSAAWALEGAALVWVGVRQNHHLANLAGVVLVGLAGIAFAEYGWKHDAAYPVLNGNVLGGLMVSLAALFASRRLDGFQPPDSLKLPYRFSARVVFAWGALWWLGTGFAEILDRAPSAQHLPFLVLFSAASAVAAVWIGRARDWKAMRLAASALFPILFMFALGVQAENDPFLQAWGWLAWPVAVAVSWAVVRDMDERGSRLAIPWHLLNLFGTTILVGLEVHWHVANTLTIDWARSAAFSVAGVAALLVWSARRRPAWPVPEHEQTYLAAALALVAFQAIIMAWLSLVFPGDPAPFSYIPILNPLGLGMVLAGLTAFLAMRWVQSGAVKDDRWQRLPLAVFAPAFFVMTTAAIIRAVHHQAGVPWDFDALFDSVQVQTALSVYWGLLGFTCMIAGARKARRAVWLIGAGLMALVVVKLFLVDLGNSGTVERIVSFIGTGVLLLVVGYFAPVPPKTEN